MLDKPRYKLHCVFPEAGEQFAKRPHRCRGYNITYLPPLLIAIYYPRAFIYFLSFAGLCCVLLQAFMPAVMSWRVRYAMHKKMEYRVAGGKFALLVSMLASASIILVSIYYLAVGVG